MSKDQVDVDFEKSLAELETLIERMEAGDLSLEESLKAFERGVVLTRDCQAALKRAELRVQALTRTGDGPQMEDLDIEELDESDDR